MQNLKLSSDLDSVPVSRLARQGTSVLQQILTTNEGITVEVQGQGAMVTISRKQYDEMVVTIQQLQSSETEDGFTEALSARFDALVVQMHDPLAAAATADALFGDAASLNDSYQPGRTETER